MEFFFFMLSQPPTTLETLKLRLVHSENHKDPFLTKDGVEYLIKALAYADAGFASEIEFALVKAGDIAVPLLVKSLSADNLMLRSVVAMALIRIGPNAERALLKNWPKVQKNNKLKWVYQYILQELGVEVAASMLSTSDCLEPVLSA
jgi:HEAT repeat protein